MVASYLYAFDCCGRLFYNCNVIYILLVLFFNVLGAACCGGALWYNQQWLSFQMSGHMQDTGKCRIFMLCGKEREEAWPVATMQECTIHKISFVHVFQDIDSEKPMMQVGQYVFAGEYEGKNNINSTLPLCLFLKQVLKLETCHFTPPARVILTWNRLTFVVPVMRNGPNCTFF